MNHRREAKKGRKVGLGAKWGFLAVLGVFWVGGEGRSGGVAMPPKVGSETLRVSLRNPKGFEADP